MTGRRVQEVTNEVAIKNFKLWGADCLPIQLIEKNKEMFLFDLQP
jgi:hypothetical protein